jgi:hypothetical protein
VSCQIRGIRVDDSDRASHALMEVSHTLVFCKVAIIELIVTSLVLVSSVPSLYAMKSGTRPVRHR